MVRLREHRGNPRYNEPDTKTSQTSANFPFGLIMLGRLTPSTLAGSPARASTQGGNKFAVAQKSHFSSPKLSARALRESAAEPRRLAATVLERKPRRSDSLTPNRDVLTLVPQAEGRCRDKLGATNASMSTTVADNDFIVGAVPQGSTTMSNRSTRKKL